MYGLVGYSNLNYKYNYSSQLFKKVLNVDTDTGRVTLLVLICQYQQHTRHCTSSTSTGEGEIIPVTTGIAATWIELKQFLQFVSIQKYKSFIISVLYEYCTCVVSVSDYCFLNQVS